MTRDSSKLKSVKVKLPWVEGTWETDDDQRKAAWELYVELVTRVAVEPLDNDSGLVREAFTSLHALFGHTRHILRAYGPSIAIASGNGTLSFGVIAVDVLNKVLRPFLSKWHPMLLEYENQYDSSSGLSTVKWERQWEHFDALKKELSEVQRKLLLYADLLADAASVPRIHSRA